jgi:hypothetical protein
MRRRIMPEDLTLYLDSLLHEYSKKKTKEKDLRGQIIFIVSSEKWLQI